MVIIFMMSEKLVHPDFLKIKVFWNKGYDAKISVHGVKILSRESNYIVDAVMWSKFCNCSISMMKVSMTSIL